MKQFMKILLYGIIGLLTISVSQLCAAEPPLPDYEFGGKPISATMVILPMPDGTATIEVDAVTVIYGTCKKIPFQVRPLDGTLLGFSNLVQSDFFDDDGDPQVWEMDVLTECKAPEGTIGWGVTAFESWTKTADYIIAEVFLQPLAPVGAK
jgi:hypothetical protein